MGEVSLGQVFISEVLGTGMLILLGAGVVANVLLARTKGFNGDWLLINFGWGFAVMAGAAVAYLAYKKHFDAEEDAAKKLAVFATGPEIRSYGWNFVTEVIGTFVLVIVVLSFAETPADLGPFQVALLVVGIGASLGGPTGYAINPARDLGPRIVHAVLPIGAKGSSDWSYSWVPVVGPMVGGMLAGLLSRAVF